MMNERFQRGSSLVTIIIGVGVAALCLGLGLGIGLSLGKKDQVAPADDSRLTEGSSETEAPMDRDVLDIEGEDAALGEDIAMEDMDDPGEGEQAPQIIDPSQVTPAAEVLYTGIISGIVGAEVTVDLPDMETEEGEMLTATFALRSGITFTARVAKSAEELESEAGAQRGPSDEDGTEGPLLAVADPYKTVTIEGSDLREGDVVEIVISGIGESENAEVTAVTWIGELVNRPGDDELPEISNEGRF